MTDVIVVGGSYAGMAAALQLLRARRQVIIIDAGQRRNRFASHSHGFLTQDGADPAEIAATARAQLDRYPTLSWRDGSVARVSGAKDRFEVQMEDGARLTARRVILATGVADTLPQIPGLSERWGKSVFHCPYCHGYELDAGRIALIANGPEAIHHAPLFTEFGQATLLTNGLFPLEAATCKDLTDRGLTLEGRAIREVAGPLEGPVEVRFQSGEPLAFSGLFVGSKTRLASLPAADLGVALEETVLGSQYRTDGFKETSVPGLYACGDAAKVPHSVSLAVADGAWAGACVHRSLVFDSPA
jgi:Thioredoxin reductase